VERRWSGRGFSMLPVLSAAALVVLGLVVAANGARTLARDRNSPRQSAANPDLVRVVRSAPAQPVTVGQLSGSGDGKSAMFHLSGADTQLVYRSQAPSFTVFLVDAKKGKDASAGFADADCNGPCSDSQVLVDQAGDYFLQVQAGNAPWQVLVQEYHK
jgi:hypothetical protein